MIIRLRCFLLGLVKAGIDRIYRRSVIPALQKDDDDEDDHNDQQDTSSSGAGDEGDEVWLALLGTRGGLRTRTRTGRSGLEERHHDNRLKTSWVATVDGDSGVVEVQHGSGDGGKLVRRDTIAVDGVDGGLLITEDVEGQLGGGGSGHLTGASETVAGAVGDGLVDVLEVVVLVGVAVEEALSGLDLDDVDIAGVLGGARGVGSHLGVVHNVAANAADAHSETKGRIGSGLLETSDGVVNAGGGEDIAVDEVAAELAGAAGVGVEAVAGGHKTLVVVAKGEADRRGRIGEGGDVGGAGGGEGHVLVEDKTEGLVGRSPVLVVGDEGSAVLFKGVIDDVEAVISSIGDAQLLSGKRLNLRAEHQQNCIALVEASTLGNTLNLLIDGGISLLVCIAESLVLIRMTVHPGNQNSQKRMISLQKLLEGILLLHTDGFTELHGSFSYCIIAGHGSIGYSQYSTCKKYCKNNIIKNY